MSGYQWAALAVIAAGCLVVAGGLVVAWDVWLDDPFIGGALILILVGVSAALIYAAKAGLP